MTEAVTRAAGAVTRAPGAGTRCLTVVVGPRRYDIVVDEQLLVAEVLALVCPGRDLIAVTMSGETVALDETVELARLETGTMLLTASDELAVPTPRVLLATTDRASAAGMPAGSSEAHTAGSRSVLQRANLPTAVAPGAGSTRRRLEYAGSAGAASASATTPVLGSGSPGSGHRGRHRAARPGRRGPRGTAMAAHIRRPGRPVAAARRVALVVVATLLSALAVGAAFVAPPTDSLVPVVVAALLTAVGLLTVQIISAPRLLSLAAPMLGVAGGAVLTESLSDGPVVAVVGGCAGGALVALAGRSGAGADRFVPRVWLAFCGGLGALGLVVLVMGMPLEVVAAMALAGAALLARVVPDLVIDVDDDVLLDISRLSVTSWSPREARRPRRRGWRIDDRAVGGVVVAASVEQLATLIGLVVLCAGASGLLLRDLVAAGDGAPVSVRLLLLAAAIALALTARAYRLRRDRTMLRLAALAPTLGVAIPGLLTLHVASVVLTSVLAVVLALALVAVALALARGYRSLWASRLADALELLALLAVLPLALWASGLVDRAMALFA